MRPIYTGQVTFLVISKGTEDDSSFLSSSHKGILLFCSGLPARHAKHGCKHRVLQYRNVSSTTVSFYLFLV